MSERWRVAGLVIPLAVFAMSCGHAQPDPVEPSETPAGEEPVEEDAGEEAEKEAARLAAAGFTGTLGGEATETGGTPTESKLTEDGKLDINAVLKARREDLTGCYDNALSTITIPEGGFVVTAGFTIEASGTVAGARILDATQRFEKAEQCFLMELATTIFPEPPDGRVIEAKYPYTIRRGN